MVVLTQKHINQDHISKCEDDLMLNESPELVSGLFKGGEENTRTVQSQLELRNEL